MDPLPLHLFYQSYVGIWLLHRDLWYEIGGYDERFIYMDWMEVDMILRLSPKYTLINLGELTDHDIYHLDHGPARVAWSTQRNRKWNPVRDLDNLPEEVYPNSENWGLTQYPLEVLPAVLPEAAQAKTLDPPRFKWLAFFLLLLMGGVPVALDNIIIKLQRLRPLFLRIWWLLFAPSTWKNRIQSVRDTVSGQPLASWPKLLMTRWSQRQILNK
jgi:hypothetical protein